MHAHGPLIISSVKFAENYPRIAIFCEDLLG